MRILIPHPTASLGGVEVYLLDLARGLVRRGSEVILALPEHAALGDRARSLGFAPIPLPSGPDPGDGGRSRCALLFRRRSLARAYASVLRSVRPDICLVAAALPKVLLCALAQGPPFLSIEASPPRRWHFRAWGAGAAYRGFLRGAAAILAHSEEIRRGWEEVGIDAKAWEVVPSLPDLERVRKAAFAVEPTSREALGVPPDALLIGMVARLEWEKGFREALDLLEDLREESPGAYLVVAGDGWQADAIRTASAARGLASRIRWLGFVPEPEPWYRRFDLLLFPSHREGLPLVPLEAMSVGCPVVVSDAGGLRGLFSRPGEEGIQVPVSDRTAVSSAVRRLRDDPGLRRRIGAAGARRAEAFSHAGMVARIENLVARAVGAAGA